MQVYLNGQFTLHSQAAVPVDDRGFLFADGVYEVIRVYNGELFQAEPHYRRMRAGLAALRIRDTGMDELPAIAQQLIADNGVTGDGTVYIQVTRGVAPRKHAFPAADVLPGMYVVAKPFKQYPDEYFSDGVPAVTVPDTRWSRCDVKSIALLPNVLANQQAHDAGAFEALFVRDGVLIEGSHSNLFAVIDGTLITYPSCNYILTGITRNVVLELARELDIPTAEAPIYVEQLAAIEEMFLSGTTTEVLPVTQLNGSGVGTGSRGPITERLQQAYRRRIEQETGAAVTV
jgi:D-alanine transaminase